MFSSITKGYEMLWKSFIRPERENYSTYDLGDRMFTLVDDRTYQRTDFSIVSSNGCRIQCSHFEPIEASRTEENMPCVIYLHGNCGSRVEGLDTVPMLLPWNMTVVCFDWAGCGLSEGEYVTLGWYERYDLEILANYLIKNRRVSCIGLWGRSMGAVAAIYFASQNFPIAGLVLDSPFSSLRKLATEIGEKTAGVPNFLVKFALNRIKSTIKEKVNFDIDELNPIERVLTCKAPAIFVAGKDDDFVPVHHTKSLYKKYAGPKQIYVVDGNHNTPRPLSFIDKVARFFWSNLHCKSSSNGRIMASILSFLKDQEESSGKEEIPVPNTITITRKAMDEYDEEWIQIQKEYKRAHSAPTNKSTQESDTLSHNTFKDAN